MFARLTLVAALAFFGVAQSRPAEAAPKAALVLAAASLQESLTEAADAYARRGHPKPVISFAASSALARQVEAGAPADLFISADEPWMDTLQEKKLIKAGTRRSFLANRLVLITPAAQPLRIRIGKGFPLAAQLGDGRLAMGEPNSVPAGKYGKAALTSLGVWQDVEPKVVGAENVRAALQLVGRGEARAGIVYETDAKAAKDVAVAGIFPAASHPPITYPLAVLASSTNHEATSFRAFLLSSTARSIFQRHGFQPR
jgi:molybdate transport system substrate-binding protein